MKGDFFRAVAAGDIPEARRLVASGIDVNAIDVEGDVNVHKDFMGGCRAVHIAADRQNREMLAALKELHADLNAENAKGWRAVDIAAKKDDVLMIEQLHALGANVTGAAKDGCTALEVAARNDNVHALIHLYQIREDKKWFGKIPRLTVLREWRTIDVIVAYGDTDMAKKFCKDSNYVLTGAAADGLRTPDIAAMHGQSSMVKCLHEQGLLVNVAGADGWRPVDRAAAAGHVGVIKMIHKLTKANVFGTTILAETGKFKWRAVDIAAARGQLGVVKLFKGWGVDVDKATGIAAAHGHAHIVEEFYGEKLDSPWKKMLRGGKDRAPEMDAAAKEEGERLVAIARDKGHHDIVALIHKMNPSVVIAAEAASGAGEQVAAVVQENPLTVATAAAPEAGVELVPVGPTTVVQENPLNVTAAAAPGAAVQAPPTTAVMGDTAVVVHTDNPLGAAQRRLSAAQLSAK